MFARRFALVSGLICLVLGVLAGVYAQLELSQSGLQFIPPRSIRYLFIYMIDFHRLALTVSLSMAVMVALPLADLSGSVSERVSRFVANVALLSLAMFGMFFGLLTADPDPELYRLIAGQVPFVFAIVCVGAGVGISLSHMIRERRLRFEPAVYLALAGLGLVWAFVSTSALSAVPQSLAVQETQYDLARVHGIAIAGVFVGFAILARLREVAPGFLSKLITALHGLAVSIALIVLMIITRHLGLSGAPRRYADFPISFEEPFRYLFIAAMALTVLILAGYLRWMWIGWKPPHADAETVASF